MQLSLPELAARVNAWCDEHGLTPANGQVGESVTERNVRYYRTLGLLDAPAGGLQGYGEKHLRQLSAIRLLQVQGTPLRRIRELLYGRSLEDLQELCRRGLAELRTTSTGTVLPSSGGEELWRMIPLTEDFLLVSRRGAALTAEQRAAVLRALSHPVTPSTKDSAPPL